VIGAYAVAEWRNGDKSWVWMWVEEVNAIRDVVVKKMRNPKDSPWEQHYDEMSKKTVIRRLAKLLPLSPEFQRAAAIEDYPEAMGSGSIDITVPPSAPVEDEKVVARLHQELLGALEDQMGGDSGMKSSLETFIRATAEANGISRVNLMEQALDRLDDFWENFQAWRQTHPQTSQDAPGLTNAPGQGGGAGKKTRAQEEAERDAAIDGAIRECARDGLFSKEELFDPDAVKERLPDLNVQTRTIRARYKAIRDTLGQERPAPEPQRQPMNGDARLGRIKAAALAHTQEWKAYADFDPDKDGGELPLPPAELAAYVRFIVKDATDEEIAKAKAEVAAEMVE